MKPSPFDLHRPRTLEEVLDLLSRYGEEAKLIAGGQSLVPLMNLRMATPAVVVDLNLVAGLAGISSDGHALRIGAMTRQKHMITDPLVARGAPLLARAVSHVGHVQTRSRGTVGGSLAHADPSAELPLVMVTLGAEFVLRSMRGARSIAAREFF
ncbi:MAG: FAD binding domain-containing protein, partial [Alphaproteobacteria bacterium]